MMRRYPAYRDSGVEWLGEVPKGWEVRELKRIASMHYGDALASDIRDDGGDVVVYGSNGPVGMHSAANALGPAVLVGRKGSYGALNWSESDCFAIDTVYFIDRTGTASHLRWLFYALHLARFEGSSQDTGVPGLSRSVAYSTQLPLPPLAEQTAIAAFLDRETAKIDTLVDEQRRLIALLREKRQAVISHAVTKGLNPAAPMKPSGVDWLGDVPEGWEVVPLKRISPAITVGIVVNPSLYVSDDGLPFIYGGDIEEGRIKHESARRIGFESSLLQPKSRLLEGDLLTVRVGAPGITAVVGRECEGGNCASVMHIRRGDFCSDWLCFAMNSRALRYQVELVQYGAAQEQFNISHAVNFMVPLPPPEEAREIADYLSLNTNKIDGLVSTAESAIALLQERRAALISAAVTGKFDVRDLASAETEAA